MSCPELRKEYETKNGPVNLPLVPNSSPMLARINGQAHMKLPNGPSSQHIQIPNHL